MTNQIEFNNKYRKEILTIKFKNEDFNKKQLLIADYPNLEKLILQNIESIDKLILRNLPKLTKCSISDCKLKELIIENCDQIKELEVDDNQLTNLNFLPSLPNLQKLNVDGNPDLASGLEFLPKGIKFSSDNTKLDYHEEEDEELKKLQKENQELKESKKNLKRAIKENVVDQLDKLDSKLGKITKKIERSGSFSQPGNTDELTTIAGQVVESIKGINENLKSELSESKTEIQILEKELIKTQSKLIKAQEELGNKQSILQTLKQNLEENPDDNQIQEKIGLYEQKITELKGEESKLKIELANAKGKLEVYEKEAKTISATDLPEDVYRLTLKFLKTKDYFYLARKQTITNLQIQIQTLENQLNQLGKMNSVSDFIIKVGSFTNSIDHGITATLGKGLKNGTNLLSSTYLSQQGQEVQLVLQNSQEEIDNIKQLDFAYSQLNSALQGNKDYDLFGILDSRYHRAFKVDYQIYDILKKNANIWENRKLNQEKMEEIYSALQKNLAELDQEINSEFLKLKSEDQTRIRKENESRIEVNQIIITNKDQRVQELESQLIDKQRFLESLINSTKEKLASKKKFTSTNERSKITQARHNLLEKFIKTGFIDSSLQKVIEEKEIDLSEITNLQNSIKNLQEQLNNHQLENQIIVNQNI